MPETVYPNRQRCKTCRKKLEGNVLAGLYCSYRCGNFPPPAKTMTDTPRQCKREVNGVWGYKTRFASKNEVPLKYRNDPSSNLYLCDNCRMYHIGHSRVEALEALSRYVNTPAELGSVIKRYRESRKIEKKTLAKKLKVPVIRLTEIEEGIKTADVGLLLKVLYELHIKLGLFSA